MKWNLLFYFLEKYCTKIYNKIVLLSEDIFKVGDIVSLEKKLRAAIKSNNINKIEIIFEDIYYEYGKLVGFIISKYVSKKEDIEELVDDVFINFFKVLYKTKIENIK